MCVLISHDAEYDLPQNDDLFSLIVNDSVFS